MCCVGPGERFSAEKLRIMLKLNTMKEYLQDRRLQWFDCCGNFPRGLTQKKWNEIIRDDLKQRIVSKYLAKCKSLAIIHEKLPNLFKHGKQVETNMMIMTVQQFIAKDKKNTLIKCIKGSPTGCKNYLHEVFRMLKQHGKRTFSLTQWYTVLKLSKLISINFISNCQNISRDDICHVLYNERCDGLNKNPLRIAKHFQHRIELLFQTAVLDSPLGKTNYYAV